MITSPIVSVIVPAYNVEKYLERCLQSIVNQTLRDIEILLINDGSSDDTPIICDEWAKKDARIRVVHQENVGIATTRNRGIALAKSDFIGFVDSDDWIEPDMYEALFCLMQEHDADLVMCNLWHDYIEDGRSVQLYDIPTGLYPKRDSLIRLLMDKRFDNYCCTKLYKKKLFEGALYPDGLWMEDHSTTFKHFYNAKCIAYINKPFYHYTRHSESFTMTPSVRMENAYYLAILERLRFCAEKGFMTSKEWALFRIKQAKRLMTTLKDLALVSSPDDHKELKDEIKKSINEILPILREEEKWMMYPRCVLLLNKLYAYLKYWS